MPDPPRPPEASAEPPVPVDPPAAVDPPVPPDDPPLPLADEPPLEPPAPPPGPPAAPPDAGAPLPARPVPVAPDEPPPWPPEPPSSDVGEAQLQSSAATARAANHPDRTGLDVGCLSWRVVICSSYSLRAREASSQFVTAARSEPWSQNAKIAPHARFGLRFARGAPVGAARRRGSTPRPARTNRGGRPPGVESDGDRDRGNRGDRSPRPD